MRKLSKKTVVIIRSQQPALIETYYGPDTVSETLWGAKILSIEQMQKLRLWKANSSAQYHRARKSLLLTTEPTLLPQLAHSG